MKKNSKQEEITYTVSSGNLFADLGLPNAEERMAKVDLTVKIIQLIRKKKLTQIQAAKLLEIDQPKVSLLVQGKISGFSLERLLRFLNLLDQDVKITVTPKARSKKAQVTVNASKPTRKKLIIPRSTAYDAPVIQAKKKK